MTVVRSGVRGEFRMARPTDTAAGRAELRHARADNRRLFGAVFLFSIFVNLLMLTGPLFMLQIYDRVITSRSEETLIALFALVAFLYLMFGLLDYARGRVMARVAARFQDRLDRRVFAAALRVMAVKSDEPGAVAAQRDLETVQRFIGSPVLLALFDMPWTPLFMAVIFLFHPLLGWVALAGGSVIIALTVLNQVFTRRPMSEAGQATMASEQISDQLKSEAETVHALGMRGHGFDRWQGVRRAALARSTDLADASGKFSTATKAFRLFLQSAILAMGAWLVLPYCLLELAVLAACIWYCVRQCRRQEVITISEHEVQIERGIETPTDQHNYHRIWAQFLVKPARHPWDPDIVSIRSHGEELELGSFLSRKDKHRLIAELRKMVAAYQQQRKAACFFFGQKAAPMEKARPPPARQQQ